MERTTAIFHEQARVDRAVRELFEHGVDESHVYVERAPAPRKDVPPNAPGGLPHRIEFAGLGGAFGMLAGLAISGSPGGDTMGTIWLVIFGGMMGLLAGGIVGMIIGGFRKERRDRKKNDWVVRVDAPDTRSAELARQLLSASGGQVMRAG